MKNPKSSKKAHPPKMHNISDHSEDEHPGHSNHGNQSSVLMDTDSEIHTIAKDISHRTLLSKSKKDAKRKRKSDLVDIESDSTVQSPVRKKSKSSVDEFSDSSHSFKSPIHVSTVDKVSDNISEDQDDVIVEKSSPKKKKKKSKDKRHSLDSSEKPSTSTSEPTQRSRLSLPDVPSGGRTLRERTKQKEPRPPPPNTDPRLAPPDLDVWAENLERDHVKLFLCQMPAKMDVEFLQDKKFMAGQRYKCSKEGNMATEVEIQVAECLSQKVAESMTCVTHRKSEDALDVVQRPLSGFITIKECVAVPDTPLPPVTPRPPRQLPPGLKQRHVPFGADHPTVSTVKVEDKDSNEVIRPPHKIKQEPLDNNNDDHGAQYSSSKAKKKKKKKKKIKEEMD